MTTDPIDKLNNHIMHNFVEFPHQSLRVYALMAIDKAKDLHIELPEHYYIETGEPRYIIQRKNAKK